MKVCFEPFVADRSSYRLNLMSIEFEKLNEGECLLCSSVGSLTGEHKIKASLLKNEFGSRKTKFFGIDGPKILQSSKSKRVHFNSKICMDCNSSRTQAGDRAFDRLHFGLKKLQALGAELTDGNNHPNCGLSVEDTTDYFRYFAKIICCFLAEVGGPRSRSLSAFARGLSNNNPSSFRLAKIISMKRAKRKWIRVVLRNTAD